MSECPILGRVYINMILSAIFKQLAFSSVVEDLYFIIEGEIVIDNILSRSVTELLEVNS